jgi:hypothetical protein
MEATGAPHALRAIVEKVLAGTGAVDAFAAGAGVPAEAAVGGVGRQIDAFALTAGLLAATATTLLLADALLAALLLFTLAIPGLDARVGANAKQGREQPCSCHAHAPPGPRIESRSVHDNLLVALMRWLSPYGVLG